MEEDDLAIVVTAFFPISSKEPPYFYVEKAKFFLKNCPAQIILFTTSEYEPIFKTMVQPGRDVRIYTLDVDENGIPIESPVKSWISKCRWEPCSKHTNNRNPWVNNKISVSLMILYLSKAWFVNKAISNIAGEKPIFWHDIGSARKKEDANRLRKWPLISKLGDLGDNKLRFFKRRDLPTIYVHDCDKDSFIAGSHIFGNRAAWAPFIDDIKNAVISNVTEYEDGLYDETIYLKLVMKNPERYSTIGSTTAADNRWFQTFELHGNNQLVLDVENNKNLIIFPSHNEPNQLFSLIYTEDKEYFSIKSKCNDLVISETDGLCFEEYSGVDKQLFSFDKTSDTYGYIKHKSSKKVLDVFDFGRDLTRIVLWELNGGNNQLFRFLEITPGEYQIQLNYS